VLQARFKYPPHWVPLPMLYDAMRHVDSATGQPRGYLRMSAVPLLGSVLFTLDVRSSQWQRANCWLREEVPQVMQVSR
jgi:glutathione gamma-glutamylcysteinyltransferase